jgi:hypothetical protein
MGTLRMQGVPTRRTKERGERVKTEVAIKKLNATIAKLNKIVGVNNKTFDRLGPASKRVAIAQDVLLQLATKKLRARTGEWGCPTTVRGLDILEGSTGELQSVLPKIESCNACALGGMLLAGVRLRNKFDCQTWHGLGFDDIAEYLSDIFEHDQLVLIEAAFETRSNPAEIAEAQEDIDEEALAAWIAKAPKNASDRMKKIMKNIIANNGTFCP